MTVEKSNKVMKEVMEKFQKQPLEVANCVFSQEIIEASKEDDQAPAQQLIKQESISEILGKLNEHENEIQILQDELANK